MPLGAGRATLMVGGDGTPHVFTDTVSGAQGNYSLATEATTDGWNGTQPLLATLTVTAILTATSTAGAFRTGTVPHAASTLTITMNSGAGFRGVGGNGGAGGNGPSSNGSSGATGGPAMVFSMDATIVDNAGEISGGGGGGAGGKGGDADPPTHGGGGGGGGFPNGTGATGGSGDGDNGGTGANGTTGGGGTGGTATSPAQTGGTGGNVATVGGSKTGASGGAAGAAINKNGNTVTLSIGSATINGDINA